MDEPETAEGDCHRAIATSDAISSRSSEEQRDDSATQTNRVLRQQFDQTGKKLRLDNQQRRQLDKRGKAMGWAQLQKYATLVRPETILGWHRKLVALKYTAKHRNSTDRQKRMQVIGELCVRFAEENLSWGYGRMQGALSNLGYKVSMTTVGNILRVQGIVPSPERGKQSNLQTFVRSHMDVMSVANWSPMAALRGLYSGGLDASRPRALPRVFRNESSTTQSRDRSYWLSGERGCDGSIGPKHDR